MNKVILSYVNKLEGYKSAIKAFHWGSKNLSQHELCDDIASEISDFQDLVSEVEQSISGKLPLNKLKPEPYKCDTLKGFVMDVIDSAQIFLKELEKLGKKYIGVKSECETFIGTMQRKLYLVNFTLQEEVRRELMGEAMYKNVPEGPDGKFDKFKGQTAKTSKTRKKQMMERIHKYGVDKRKYNDPMDALKHLNKVVKDFGASLKCTERGEGSNEYKISISYEDGMKLNGYVIMTQAEKGGYQAEVLLSERPEKVLECTIGELKALVNEAAMRIVNDNYKNILHRK